MLTSTIDSDTGRAASAKSDVASHEETAMSPAEEWISLEEAIAQELTPAKTVDGLDRMIQRHNKELAQGDPFRIRKRNGRVVRSDLGYLDPFFTRDGSDHPARHAKRDEQDEFREALLFFLTQLPGLTWKASEAAEPMERAVAIRREHGKIRPLHFYLSDLRRLAAAGEPKACTVWAKIMASPTAIGSAKIGSKHWVLGIDELVAASPSLRDWLGEPRFLTKHI